MASTDEIMTAARKLGELIGTHEAATRLEDAAKKLEADRDAQRAVNDFNRLVQAISQKQAAGQPIEVADKQKLDAAKQAVSSSLTLQSFQMAQMDYLDLMRQVDDAIANAGAPDVQPTQAPTPAAGGGGAGPIVME